MKNGLTMKRTFQVVESFNCLGTFLKYNGNFALNDEYLVGNTLKALNILWYNCYK